MTTAIATIFEKASQELEMSGISGIGASAAIRAMAPYWEGHLKEGHSSSIVLTDTVEMQRQVSAVCVELLGKLSLELATAAA